MVDLLVVCVDILVLPVSEACVDHAFFDYTAYVRARVSIPCEQYITEEEVGESSLEIKVEGVVERDKIVYRPKGKVLDHRLPLGLGLNQLREDGRIVLAVVLAESDGFADLSP